MPLADSAPVSAPGAFPLNCPHAASSAVAGVGRRHGPQVLLVRVRVPAAGPAAGAAAAPADAPSRAQGEASFEPEAAGDRHLPASNARCWRARRMRQPGRRRRRPATAPQPSASHSSPLRDTSPPLPTTGAAPRLSSSRSLSERRDSFAAPVHPTRGASTVSRKFLASGALALALFAAPPASAASDADLAQIRDEIRQLKENYEARIQALEARLKDAEAASRAKPADAACRGFRPAGPAPAHVFVERSRRVQPGDFGRAAGPLRQPVAGPRRSTRSAASPRAATSDRASAACRLAESELATLGQRRRQVRRQPDRLADAGEHRVGRGGVRHV